MGMPALANQANYIPTVLNYTDSEIIWKKQYCNKIVLLIDLQHGQIQIDGYYKWYVKISIYLDCGKKLEPPQETFTLDSHTGTFWGNDAEHWADMLTISDTFLANNLYCLSLPSVPSMTIKCRKLNYWFWKGDRVTCFFLLSVA